MKTKLYPKYLGEFVNELQINLARSLKKKGSCIKKGRLTITKQAEKFMIRKFRITKRMKLSDILNKLGLDQNIITGHSDNEPSTISNFKIRLGNNTMCNYTTLKMLPLDKSYILNPIFHWEYLREVQMKEKQEETNARHKKIVEQQHRRSNC